MPWYWTDEVAPILVANGSIDAEAAATLVSLPVAHRSEQETVEEAAEKLMEDGEIPLAARPRIGEAVSPALHARGGIEVLAAAPGLRLRPFSLPADANDSETPRPQSKDRPLAA